MNGLEKLSSDPCKQIWHKLVYKIKTLGYKLEMVEVMVAEGAKVEDSEVATFDQMEIVPNANFVESLAILCGNSTTSLIKTSLIYKEQLSTLHFFLLLPLTILQPPLFSTPKLI